MKTIVVLVMHGMSPSDFPKDEKQEFMKLRSQLAQHSHSITSNGDIVNSVNNSNNTSVGGNSGRVVNVSTGNLPNATGNFPASAAEQYLPPFVVIMYIIKS